MRQAIFNTLPGGYIVFAPGVAGTITLTNGQLFIGYGMNIYGPGPGLLTISGNNASRVLTISAEPAYDSDGVGVSGGVNMSGLTIADGVADYGAGIYVTVGELQVTDCLFARNVATSTNGGSAIFFNSAGLGLGEMVLDSGLDVNYCTFTGNGGLGSTIFIEGNAVFNYFIEDTICGNTNGGVAVYTSDFGSSMRMGSCTIFGNGGTGFASSLDSNKTNLTAYEIANISGTIIAGNGAGFGGGSNVPGMDVNGAITSFGNNLIGQTNNSTGWVLGSNGGNGGYDQAGSADDALDPSLGPLQWNGGDLPTMAPSLTSAVIDQGANSGLGTDERGSIVPYDYPSIPNAGNGDGSDIGAYESNPNTFLMTWGTQAVWRETTNLLAAFYNRGPSSVSEVFLNSPTDLSPAEIAANIIFINSETTSNYPDTLTISRLYVGQDILALTNAGTASPLHVKKDCHIHAGGMISIDNSALQVDGTFYVGWGGAATFTLNSGTAQMATLAVADSDLAAGTVNLNGGSLAIATNFAVGAGDANCAAFVNLNGSIVTTPRMTVGRSDQGSFASVTLNSGTLCVTNAGGGGVLDLEGGTFTLNPGGSLVVDSLIMTNPAAQFINNGGTIIYPKAAFYGTNLLVNPGAEAGPASANGNTIESVPGWNTAGNFTAVQYGAAFITNQPSVGGGSNFFAGGPSNALSSAWQDVDVSGIASDIDADAAACTLSGWLGGYLTDGDNTVFTAYFLNASGQTNQSLWIGPVTPAQRNNQTGFLYEQSSARIPIGTRTIRCSLVMTRSNGAYNDGYADDLSLVLSNSSPSGVALANNLLVNPGGEIGQASSDGTVTELVPGWLTSGAFTVARYSGSTGQTATTPGPSTRGNNFFYGGITSSNASNGLAVQYVDVYPRAADIDATNLSCNVSGWFGGFSNQNDNATLSVVFLNAAGQTNGTLALGPVLAADRTNLTSLLFRSASATIPAGTRTIECVLSMTWYTGGYNDGAADNLTLDLVPITTPQLGTLVSGANATISWQANLGGWTLQSSTNLSANPVIWIDVPPPYQTNGSTAYWSMPVATNVASMFFRLRD
jgi:hypothetical protein